MYKAVTVAVMVVSLLISQTAAAADIYAFTRETSQGGVWEYYIRTETFKKIDSEEYQIDVIVIRTDRWGRNEKPRITEWHFIDSDETGFICIVGDKGVDRPRDLIAVQDSSMAMAIHRAVMANC